MHGFVRGFERGFPLGVLMNFEGEDHCYDVCVLTAATGVGAGEATTTA